MKTKWMLPTLMTLALGVAALAMTGCNKTDHDHSDGHAHQYTCPMHPEVVQDKSGTCPKCNMKLVEKTNTPSIK
jgi:membrane fusion protein, copper/silver efflux system